MSSLCWKTTLVIGVIYRCSYQLNTTHNSQQHYIYWYNINSDAKMFHFLFVMIHRNIDFSRAWNLIFTFKWIFTNIYIFFHNFLFILCNNNKTQQADWELYVLIYFRFFTYHYDCTLILYFILIYKLLFFMNFCCFMRPQRKKNCKDLVFQLYIFLFFFLFFSLRTSPKWTGFHSKTKVEHKFINRIAFHAFCTIIL